MLSEAVAQKIFRESPDKNNAASAGARSSEDLNTDVDSDEILQGFAHFETLDMQMTRVKEVVHPGFALMVGLETTLC